MADFSDCTLAFMAPDGYTIDFSDAWSKKGWSTFMPLLAHMINPETGIIDQEPDPCFTAQFFSNKYYYHGFSDPWYVNPALAQDRPNHRGGSTSQLPNGVEIETWEIGGWGSIRIGLPNSTSLGQTTDVVSRFNQTDQIMIATSAIPNSSPHTELDFATFVWTAFGNRLLYDFGYGSISNTQYDIAESSQIFDNNPVAHNTLVIPEALYENEIPTPLK